MEFSKGELCGGSSEVDELKREAKEVVVGVGHQASTLLRLIDALCRLGIAHHFRQDVRNAFQRMVPSAASDLDLFHTSLQFRLLRQHALPITPAVFDKFVDANGKFAEHLAQDVEGLLSLYEASHLRFGEEQVMEEAKDFSCKNLNLLLSDESQLKANLRNQVQLSLQLPLFWRMPRVEARNFIDIYQQDHGEGQRSVLLRLAKLEYNLMQALCLDELKEVKEWWTAVKAKHELGFARDRLVECYFWAMGSVPEREFSKGRKNLAVYACLATVLDDIYDIQGSIDDLKKFTEAVKQWDIKAADELPDYMKVFYKAMVENGDQTATDAAENLDLSIDFMPYIKEQWASYCKALLVEAKWSRESYMPSYNDYMRNAWVSIGISIGLVYALLAQAHSIAQYLPGCLENWTDSELFYLPSLITRLHDDLTYSEDEMERGEPNAVVCYMVEQGVSEEEAKVHMRVLLNNSWTRLTEIGAPQGLPNSLLNAAVNMTRSVQRIYLHGDWFGVRTQSNQDCIIQHLLTPIQ